MGTAEGYAGRPPRANIVMLFALAFDVERWFFQDDGLGEYIQGQDLLLRKIRIAVVMQKLAAALSLPSAALLHKDDQLQGVTGYKSCKTSEPASGCHLDGNLVLQEGSLMQGHPGNFCKTCRKTVRDELTLAVAYSASLPLCSAMSCTSA